MHIMFLVLFCKLLFYFTTPCASYFIFTNPIAESVAASDAGASINAIFYVDQPASIQWRTNSSNYSVGIGQSYVAGCFYYCPHAAVFIIYNKSEDQPEEGGFTWNISSSNLIQVDTSSFWMYSTVGEDDAGAASEGFNVTDKEVSQVSVATSSSSTSSSLSSTALPSSSISTKPSSATSTSSLPTSTNHLPSSSTTTKLASPTQTTTNQNSTQKHEDIYVGISVTLGAMLLFIIVILIIKCCRRNRNTNPSSQMLVENNQNVSFAFGIAGSSELSADSTKFELPGMENELSRLDGPYELPVNPYELSANN